MADPRRLARVLFERLRPGWDPRVRDAVARRVTEKVALAVLAQPVAAFEPIHAAVIRLADGAEHLPLETLRRLFDEICSVLLVGHVVPVQTVHERIDEARAVWLAHCICRGAGRVRDRRRPETGLPFLTAAEEACRPLFERLLDVRARTRGTDAATDPRFGALLDRFARRRGDPAAGAGAFFEETWPFFEILLDHPEFAPEWRETMRLNRRTRRVHPEILHAWVDLAWLARGVVFTSMTVVDARYTICACPGPENDRGCLLFHWACFAGNTRVLHPNTELVHGDRRSRLGRPLPCARFPGRRADPCFGCGCRHDEPHRPALAGRPDPRPPYDPAVRFPRRRHPTGDDG